MGKSTVTVVRVIAVIVIALAVVAAVSTYGGISEAEGMKDLNELMADSAPQQQVVNGWYVGDELKLIATQNVALIALGAAILFALTVGLTGRDRPQAEVPGSDLPPKSTTASGEADLSDRDGNHEAV